MHRGWMAAPVVALWCVAAPAGHEPASGVRLNDLTAQWEVNPEPILAGFHNLYDPCVVFEPGAEYPYKMWFFGYAAEDFNPAFPPGGDQIFHARSRDLRSWEVYAGDAGWDTSGDPRRYVPVMVPSPAPFDGMANGDPSVVRRDGRYYMALSSVGFDSRQDAAGTARLYNVSCVLGATSEDGIHWTKTVRPIAIWEHEFTRGWEIVDGKIPPAPEGYQGSYHRPSLMFDEGRWRLWFDYFVPGTFVSMGYAENRGDFTDPAAWHVLRAGDEPLLRDWPNTSVVRYGNTYYAFSDAPGYPADWGGDGRQLTMATSPDGLNWTVLGHLRPNGQEGSHVPQAVVLPADGADWLYLFYSWKPARQEGAARDVSYKQIRWMRLKLADHADPASAQPAP